MMQKHLPMGYKIVNGAIEIQEEAAKIVKTIFIDYLDGKSMKIISNELTAAGVLNANHKASWNHGSVGIILKNVKYQGDEVYPPLIDKVTFKKAQERRSRVNESFGKTHYVQSLRNQTLFSGKIRCGDCDENYKKYIEHAGKTSEKVKWKCKHYIYQNKVLCKNHFLNDDEIIEIFIKATKQLIRKKWLIDKIKPQEPPKMSVVLRGIEKQIKELESAEDYSNPRLCDLIFARAQGYYVGATVYDQPRNAEKLKEALVGIDTLCEFDEELFKAIVKQITIYKDTKITVEYIGGIVIEESVENYKKSKKGQ